MTDPESEANNIKGHCSRTGQPIPLWYVNQGIGCESGATRQIGPAPKDATTNVHEYRIDWTGSYTAFYVDSVLQKAYVRNVPNKPGPWVWNNWANGDRCKYRMLHSKRHTKLCLSLVMWSTSNDECIQDPKHRDVLQHGRQCRLN